MPRALSFQNYYDFTRNSFLVDYFLKTTHKSFTNRYLKDYIFLITFFTYYVSLNFVFYLLFSLGMLITDYTVFCKSIDNIFAQFTRIQYTIILNDSVDVGIFMMFMIEFVCTTRFKRIKQTEVMNYGL